MAEFENKKKTRLLKIILKRAIKSPINSIFIVAALYSATQAFLLSQTFSDKAVFFMVIGVWILFFLAKQLFLFLILILLLGGGAYLYYDYTHKEARQCEENGGYWNSNTQICEEKKSSCEKLKNFWEKNKSKKQEQNETNEGENK